MEEIKIVSRWDSNKVLLCGKYESIKDCLEKNRGADLRGADLRGAYLRGAKNYVNSHDFWLELIRRHSIKDFTEKEWAIIGQVYTHRLCWGMIKKDYQDIVTIFEKLEKDGFGEYSEEFKKQ